MQTVNQSFYLSGYGFILYSQGLADTIFHAEEPLEEFIKTENLCTFMNTGVLTTFATGLPGEYNISVKGGPASSAYRYKASAWVAVRGGELVIADLFSASGDCDKITIELEDGIYQITALMQPTRMDVQYLEFYIEKMEGKGFGQIDKIPFLGCLEQYDYAKEYSDHHPCYEHCSRAVLEEMASNGDTKAMYTLGHYYENGYAGFKKDLNQYMHWMQMAAEKGHALACNEMGSIYEDGKPAKKDKDKAFEWFKKGAELGDSGSQTMLGYLYRKKKDYDNMLFWTEKGAMNDNYNAMCNYGHYYYFADEFGGTTDYEKAFKFLERASLQGHQTAMYLLCDFYEYGYYVEKDLHEANYWSERSGHKSKLFKPAKPGAFTKYESGDKPDFKPSRREVMENFGIDLDTDERTSERLSHILRHGECQGAVVVGMDPLYIAAYSGEMDSVVLLKYKGKKAERMARMLKVGSRLLAINSYEKNDELAQKKAIQEDLIPTIDTKLEWQEICPIIADFVVDDRDKIRDVLKGFDEQYWVKILEMGKERFEFKSSSARDLSPDYAHEFIFEINVLKFYKKKYGDSYLDYVPEQLRPESQAEMKKEAQKASWDVSLKWKIIAGVVGIIAFFVISMINGETPAEVVNSIIERYKP